MPRSSRHQPRTFWEWFDQNVNLVFVALTAIGAGALVMIAVNGAPHAPANAVAGPIPTFGTAQQAPTRVLFIGDSYSAGAGLPHGAWAERWTTLVSHELGWVEVNESLGGTGYITASDVNGCGRDYCETYPEAIQASKTQPSIVVISGGRNDKSALTTKAVSSTIKAAQSRWPDSTVLVTTPLWDDDLWPTWMDRSVADVKAACTATGATYIDLGQPLLGNPERISDDSVHPNAEGYRAIADAFIAQYRP